MSGINEDGTLKKFATPQPTTRIAIAAAEGDLIRLQTECGDESDSEPSSKATNLLLAVDEWSNTALIWAADRGQTDALRWILDRLPLSEENSGLNARGYLGNTALGRAARGGHVACVRLLLGRADVDPNLCNDKQQYPLHFAAFKRHLPVVQAMLASGKCDAAVIDRKGRTPAEDTGVAAIRECLVAYRETGEVLA
jgi:ankyrin repeat protein